MKLHELFPEISLNPSSAKDIKQWILQLALKGSLTKDFSFKNPIQKNKISFSELEIPKHWRVEFFKNICDFKMGKTPPSKEQVYWDGNTPWVSIADMEQNGVITETRKTLSEKGFEYSFNKIACKKGTLLMSFKLTIGKTSILGIDACHNEAIISIYPKEFIIQRYLFWFLPILSNIGPQVSALMGNTLNKSKLEDLIIPIQPLEEQQAIVYIVESLFKEVDELAAQAKHRIELKRRYAAASLNRLCEADTPAEWQQIVSVFPEIFNDKQTIKTLRETILQLAVQGKLSAKWRISNTPSGTAFELLEQIKAEKAQLIKEKKIKTEKSLPAIEADEIPFELPEGWVWCRWNDVCSAIGDVDHKMPLEQKEGIPYISPRDFEGKHSINFENSKKISNEDYKQLSKKIKPERNDLIFPRYGTIGVNRLVDFDFDFLVSYSCAILKQNTKIINPKYGFLVSVSKITKLEIEKYINKTTQPNVGIGSIKQFLFPLPPISEQQIIVEKVNSLMGFCDELEKEVDNKQNLLNNFI